MKNVKRIAVVVLSVLVILTAFTACMAKTPDKLIIGSWRDSTGTTGYEFREDGSCVITFADVVVPIINIKYTGETIGTYSVSELEDGTYNVKIVYTIISRTITKEYKFTVENSALYLTDITDGTQTVYMAYVPQTTTSAPVQSSVAA